MAVTTPYLTVTSLSVILVVWNLAVMVKKVFVNMARVVQVIGIAIRPEKSTTESCADGKEKVRPSRIYRILKLLELD